MQGTAGLSWGSTGVGVPRPRSCCLCQGMGSSSARVSALHQGQAQPVKTLLPTWLSPCFNTLLGLAATPTSRDPSLPHLPVSAPPAPS